MDANEPNFCEIRVIRCKKTRAGSHKGDFEKAMNSLQPPLSSSPFLPYNPRLEPYWRYPCENPS
jgi:hypothetical protein